MLKLLGFNYTAVFLWWHGDREEGGMKGTLRKRLLAAALKRHGMWGFRGTRRRRLNI